MQVLFRKCEQAGAARLDIELFIGVTHGSNDFAFAVVPIQVALDRAGDKS